MVGVTGVEVMCPYDVRPILVSEMTAFVAQHHYSTVMPRITKVCYGGVCGGGVGGANSFCWGAPPLHPIKKTLSSLLPSKQFTNWEKGVSHSWPSHLAAPL